MKKHLLIAATLCFISSTLFAFQRGNEVINIPSAKMEKSQFFEFGCGSQLGYSTKIYTSSTVSLRMALSDYFEYGMTDENNQLFHHFQLGFKPIGTPSKRAFFAVGIRNIGWTPDSTKDKPITTILAEYAVFSFQTTDYGTLFHLGLGENHLTHEFVPFFGAEVPTSWGTLICEYDGRVYNFGYQHIMDNHIKLFTSFTFNTVKSTSGEIPNYFKIGFSLMDNYTPMPTKPPASPKPSVPTISATTKASATPTKTAVVKPIAEKEVAPTLSIKAPTLPTESVKLKPTDNIKINPTDNSKIIADLTKTLKNSVPKDQLKDSIQLLLKGMNYYSQGQFDSALDEYKAFVKLNPDLAIGYMSLGSIYMQLGMSNEALNAWKMAKEKEPDNTEINSFFRQMQQQEQTTPSPLR
jgi:hypothetical protein